jgi:small-conductance mechanosensitive channel
MKIYEIQIIETLFVLLGFLLTKFALKYFVKLTILNAYFKLSEKNDVMKIINLILIVVLSIIIIAIWSVKQDQILVFASSLITVFGVALFAEMSILSNITACLILFFQHPIKVGDTISIRHDGNEVEGELIEISYFFVFIKTKSKGTLTIPNAILLKNSFCVIGKISKS